MVPAQNVPASLRFRAKLNVLSRPASLCRLQGRDQAAVHVSQQVADDENPADDEEDRLVRAGPDKGFDAAEGDEEDADEGEQRERRSQGPAEDQAHGHAGRVEPHAGSDQTSDQKVGGARVLRGRAESVAEELVDARAIVFVECRDEEKRDDQSSHRQADQELKPSPVFGEGRVRHADEGQGTDLRRDKRQARDDPRDLPAAEEEILRVLLLAPEDVGDDEQQQHRPGDDRAIEPAQRSGQMLGDRVFDNPSSFPTVPLAGTGCHVYACADMPDSEANMLTQA